ncbi:transport and Golgi organization protein 6 homolog [Actinia tenebrosa]|uniref:Transport and Golgi organization protein 6 homolog n=1 Tax=Actinia tenebrosa TaxID=6105 RepID=A0A6P8I6M5_ACTTE|nr:transport and Golgi organization protein 6 homolog [Actinia tenebrosa]
MAESTVKSPSIVTSAIRLLTSTSTKTTEDKPIKYFEEMLLSRMKQLKTALLSDINFDTLRQRLQNENCEFWKRFLEDELEPEGMAEDTSKGAERTELEAWKFVARWKFVKICLNLMLELKSLLQELVSGVSMEKTNTKGIQNPKLNVDALSVSDQKVVLTCIQFIICLGVYPNLHPGVGIPVERRSGYSSLIKGPENEFQNDKQLYECIRVLLECIKHASLGSIILSCHLGDVLTGLIQICYAPASTYNESNGASKQTCAKNSLDMNKTTRTIHSQDSDEIKPVSSGQSTDEVNAKPVSCGESELRINVERESITKCWSLSASERSVDPCNRKNEWKKNVAMNEIKEKFISASEREKCLLELERLVERVYQPLIVRELLMIQGGTKPERQQKTTGSTRNGVGKISVKREDKNVTCDERPKWFTNICGQLLSARLMKENGVQAVLRGILENTADPHSTQNWRKCDMVARLIANCPSQATSVEEYYSHIAPQVLNLLHITNAELGKQFVRVASSAVKTMAKQHPSLCKKYLLEKMMTPLLRVTQIPGQTHQLNQVVADEAALTQCIEDIHKVFVVGSDPQSSFLLCLTAVVHPIFQLFCFTRKGVSHLRSPCQEILLQFLKHIEPTLALKTLYILVYHELPPHSFSDEHDEGGVSGNDSKRMSEKKIPTAKVSNKCTGEQDDKRKHSEPLESESHNSDMSSGTDIPIELMRNEYTFCYGDSGGIIIKSCDLQSSASFDDVLGRLTGDMVMNYEVQALCLVELLVNLNNDKLSGDFFLHLMKELTNIVSQEEGSSEEEPEDLQVYDRQASADQRSLLILHLLALMCDKLGPSILKDVQQMLAFIKSTLQRGCALCETEEGLLEGGLVSETLTMAFGMLSAIMGGASKVEAREKSSLHDLLPLLEKLSTHHPDVEVKEMANDLRIAIATHGAVWSQQMKEMAENLGKKNRVTQEDFVSDKDSSKDTPNQSSDTQFDEAFAELCDPLIPVRGYAMITLAKLLHNRHPKALAQADTLLKIFTDQLSHDDSYIYLAAIQGMVALAAVKTELVLPYLAREFATCRNAQQGTANYKRSPETKMKLGEALVKAVRECGELIPRYSQHLMSSLLSGVKDPDEMVRASSLSNIGDMCKLLRYSVGPIIQEIFSCLSSVLQTDQSDQVRRAAVLALTLLLQGLGQDSIQVLSSNLRELYHLLKIVEACDKDETTRIHAQVALGQLDTIMREFLFPKETFSKKIQVLP